MKCGGEEENNHVHKCPLCSTQRDDIHALKYHIRKEHNKNKRGKFQLKSTDIKMMPTEEGTVDQHTTS